ncbi:MAG: hypothetical protein LBH61_01470 [Dysgonamonadaceae bacterium]|jgi:hypothetical protein|nr:hypothetical protein [Dysgonamonadaceae bacterium]
MTIRTIACSLFLLIPAIVPAWAQPPVIVASLDSAQIMIGEQTRLHLEIAAAKDCPLQLPWVTDTLMQGIEVLDISQPDTSDIGNNRVQIKYDYLITSFDSAAYLLPPFRLIAGADTFYSNEPALKVSTLPVDTQSGEYYDIKDIMRPPLVLADYVYVLYYILAGCLLLLLVLYIILRKKEQQPVFSFQKEEKTKLPPHVRALQALDGIKTQKLWQQGKEKEYHSLVSDTLRKYIEERFQVYAPEMTSGETLQKMRGISDADFVYDNLKQLLLLADLVKFAKYRPVPEENELSIRNAYLFVDSTIPVRRNEADGESEKNETINP